MPSDANTERMEFMRAHGLTHCTWDEHGNVTSATRPEAPRVVAPSTGQPRPARDLAAMLAARKKRANDVAFAHSSTRPIIEDKPTPESVVPRAVRAKQDARGRTEVG